MDSFELNKIIGAILLVALLVIGIGKVSNLVFKINKPEKSNYKVELDVESAEIKGDKEPVQREIVDIAALLSTGDLAHGEKVFKKCSACHSIKSGGGNKIGPALYNVVGRKVGALDDYKYSKALAEYSKNWSFEELNGFLLKPKDWIITLSKKQGELTKKQIKVKNKKDMLENVKKTKTYKTIKEIFDDAELVDVKNEETND